MFQTGFDSATSLLKVSFSGYVVPDEAKRCVEEAQALLQNVQAGFRLLTDLSGLETMELACVPFLKQMMDLCNEKGVETVVRVIPDPRKDIGLNILALFHYERRVRIITCETREQALKVLANA
jgi:anti-anti-sigma regulatory factor